MRLSPIEKPASWFIRMLYWFSKRQFGKVFTPVKVIYNRNPALAKFSYQIFKTEKKLALSPSLILLIKTWISILNGCTFCADIALAMAIQQKLGKEKFNQLSEYKTSELFSEPEKAALRYAEEITQNKMVSDETFENLRKQYNEREIIDITWLSAIENYYNSMSVPLMIESDHLEELAEKINKT